ncbi:MAG: tetratricopeptide repeat protein [Thermoguttaceae bacterium]
MVNLLRSSGIVLGLCVALGACRGAAADDGQADLDKATQLKIGASTVNDLAEVVRLCESAIQKGLDQNNVSFAKNLLSAALAQRGALYAGRAFRSLLLEGNWQEQRKQALGDLERAVQMNPTQPQSLYLIARLNLLPEGNAKRVAEALDQAVAQSGDEPEVKGEALVLRASIQKEPAKKLADLDEATRVAPGDASVLRARGIVRAEMNKLDAALDDFNKAIELDPKQAPTYQLKALVLVKQKKLDEALAVLQKAREIIPGNIDLPAMKARIDAGRADYPAALEESNRAIGIDANNLEVLLLRAGIYQEMGRKADALADIDHVLKLKPRLSGAMRDRAVLLADLGKFDEAVTQLEQLRQANPKDPLTLLQLGLLYSAGKKYETAAKHFSDLLSQYPDEWMGYRGRADAYLNLGRRAEALADYDKALQLRPKDVGILNNLAWVLATAPEEKLRDGKRALVLAKEASKLTEYKHDYILSTLAAAHAEDGDFASAQEWAAKAVELGTKEHVEQIKKELESYKAGKPWREALPEPEEKKKPKDP